MGRRNKSAKDSRKYFEWLEFASEDLLAARILKESESCSNTAAFHCQQCIEKALKAYLLLQGFSSPDGHNLTWLCRKAVLYNEYFAEWRDESAFLNRYYIETRYPADIPLDVSQTMLNKIYHMANEMYDFICREVYEE